MITYLFQAQILTRIHHKNLVSMIGYCTALVYEYMSEGTLREQIAGMSCELLGVLLELARSEDQLTLEEEHTELHGSTQLCLFLLFNLTETDYTYTYLKTHTS
jgi:hypothetical protein